MKRSLSAGHTPRLPIRGVPLVRTQLAKTTERLFLNVPPFVSNFIYRLMAARSRAWERLRAALYFRFDEVVGRDT
jgi:hypothetical protein